MVAAGDSNKIWNIYVFSTTFGVRPDAETADCTLFQLRLTTKMDSLSLVLWYSSQLPLVSVIPLDHWYCTLLLRNYNIVEISSAHTFCGLLFTRQEVSRWIVLSLYLDLHINSLIGDKFVYIYQAYSPSPTGWPQILDTSTWWSRPLK